MMINPKLQDYMKNRYTNIEDQYYKIVIELVSKLEDLGVKQPIPDLQLQEFSFFTDWKNGNISSLEVLNILETMNFKGVAKTRLTRKLINFMENEDQLICDYVKHVIIALENDVVLEYEQYLNLICTWFKKLSKADADQVKLTWLQQKMSKDDSVSKSIEDLTFNQVVRQVKTYVGEPEKNSYFVGNNIIVFDAGTANNEGGRYIHWIFGPQSYISLLKDIFNVKIHMELTEEKEYILNLIGDYAS